MGFEDRLKNIMHSILTIEPSDISDHTSQDNVPNWDSLAQMNLLIALEEEFQVVIPDEDAAHITSYKLIKLVLQDLLPATDPALTAPNEDPVAVLLEKFKTVPNEIAFIDDKRIFYYCDIITCVKKYSRYLIDNNIKVGDIVLVVADYSPEMFCFILALMQNRNILAPLTKDSMVEEDNFISVSEAQWLIYFSIDMLQIKLKKLDVSPKNPLTRNFVTSKRPGLLLFTSGSSGTPKAILHDFSLVLKKFETPRKKMTAITFLMLDHFGGINTLLHIVSSLGTVVTVKTRSVQAICETIENYKVELLPTTPSFLNMLVGTEVAKHFDLSSLRLISYGTEVMPQITLDRLSVIFPKVRLQQTYGLSELGVLRSQSRPDGSLWVKIGGEGFQTKVVDGTLWIKSAFAMVGYLNAPCPFDDNGWFNTQDRVEVDGDYYKILGRVTDLMNIGGQKVYPAEIEEVIIEMDNIEDVAVFSEKNNLLGQIVVARVVLKSPEPVQALKKRIRKNCRQKMLPFKVPSKVIIAEKDIYSSRLKKLRKVTVEGQSVSL